VCSSSGATHTDASDTGSISASAATITKPRSAASSKSPDPSPDSAAVMIRLPMLGCIPPAVGKHSKDGGPTLMRRHMRTGSVIVLLAGAFTVAPAVAQNVPGTLQPQAQTPGSISPIQPSSAPTSGLPANVITPSTTPQLAPNPGVSSAPFTSAGRGLPGMQGGPPVNGPVGARDPSSDFMRPPNVGPLFCDPALNIQC
jgi:hypothetical protein